MKWNEIVVTTTSVAGEAVSEMLMQTGAAGVSIEDPNDLYAVMEQDHNMDYIDEDMLNRFGSDAFVKAYFPETMNLHEIMQHITLRMDEISQYLDTGKAKLVWNCLDEEDWANAWKKHYHTFFITDNIVIKPTWLSYEKKADECVIELDPGMAFGSGTHETTQMCAQLLEKYSVQAYQSLNKPFSVLDIGTGSGILSMVASSLNAKSVISYDIDAVAVKVAQENTRLNNLHHLEIQVGKIEDYQGAKCEIIVANIVATVINQICPFVKSNLAPEGYFITSGIISSRKDEVVQTYLDANFKAVDVAQKGEWVAIVFQCQDSL